MKILVSRRFERELEGHLRESLRQFGERTAEATFAHIDKVLRTTLAEHPRVGRYLPVRDCFRYPVASTPFVIYYKIKSNSLIAVAIRHGAQNRREFEGG